MEVIQPTNAFDPENTLNPEHPKRCVFEIQVTNVSDRFLSFHLRAYPQGGEESDFRHWYSLTPRVCAKKPPGTTTNFTLEVIDSPVPGAEGNIPLTFEVRALEDQRCRTKVIGKNLEVKAGRYLNFDLLAPNHEIRVDPNQPIYLPVKVRNTRKKSVEATFRLTSISLPEDWIDQNERLLEVGPDSWKEFDFLVNVPEISKTQGEGRYEFKIEIVKPKLSREVSQTGVVVVNPIGTVDWKIPKRSLVFPDDRSSSETNSDKLAKKKNHQAVAYPFEVVNLSNIRQNLVFSIVQTDRAIPETEPPPTLVSNTEKGSEKEPQHNVHCQVDPPSLTLEPGEKSQVTAKISNLQEPSWWDRLLHFEINVRSLDRAIDKLEPHHTSFSSINFSPSNTQILHLTLRLPTWKKGLIGLLVVLLLGAVPLVRYFFAKRHTNTINTVSFVSDGQRVVSGSSDTNVFTWQVNRRLENWFLGWKGVRWTRDLPMGDKVRVVRDRPTASSSSENAMAAAGLKNGEILIWNPNREDIPPLSLNNRNDRSFKADNVFDLQFSNDSRYLFSAHGSGRVRSWDLQNVDLENSSTLEIEPVELYLDRDRKSAAYAIAETSGHQIYGNPTDWLIVSGERNSLWIWARQTENFDANNDAAIVFDLSSAFREERVSDFQPTYGKNDFVTSLAIQDEALVSADTQGYVRLWSLERMRQCLKTQSLIWDKDSDVVINASCKNKAGFEVIQWQNREVHQQRPVRSVAIARYRQCYYFASTGDDGRVALWSFDGTFAPANEAELVKILYRRSSAPLNTVDIVADIDTKSILVVSNSANGRVQIYRHRVADASCQ
ncbi:hypothetical protein [Baaleninema simplex]|uniref:hypothetical protein n=1 Tax=Baaleninema simplex TaxID=2862350 RepID=UPI0011817C97|nr:hypothetical protein [Baaleninema simplex]